MSERWIGHYDEGYVDQKGNWVTIDSRVRCDHGWQSPDAAVQHWQQRGDFDVPTVSRYRNGKQEIDDVNALPEFASLGVTKIWRRITFTAAN
jgi:hypothetical protein